MVSAFISYKWEDDLRNQWIYKFYNDLRTKHGVDAKIDTFEVGPGDSFTEYMVEGIQNCDCLLFIITPGSVRAVEESRGGVSFELQIGLAREISGDPLKIVPIYREGNNTPAHLRNKRYIDFRDDGKYDHNLIELANWLKGKVKPPVIVNNAKPKPVLNVAWLRAKADLYLACALIAKAGFTEKTIPSEIRKELTGLKYAKIDSGSIEKVGDGIIFLAYVLREENSRDTLVEIWAKVGRWEGNEKGTRLTKDLYTIISEVKAELLE